MSTPTVFVVDDDGDLRDSLSVLLRALGYFVKEFASAEEFSGFYQGDQPGCLILDIRMPGQSGLELYEALVQEQKQIPVIFITAHADVSTAVTAMKSGAIEFLEKPFDRQTLADRVETALQTDALWRTNRERFQQLNDSIQQLNATDLETLEQILQGEPNKAMAARFQITERAVELRRQRLMQRLGVRSLSELLELTITHRLLEEFRAMLQARSLPP